MCGILGVINGEKNWNGLQGTNKYMQQGCVAGLFRGEDSTGLMQVSKNFDIKILKATVDGYNFVQHKKVQDALRNVDSNYCTIIHHRAATHGSVSYDNCHPFQHETPDGRFVVGVHNGTIHSYNRNEDGVSFDVDSDWLYYRIAKLGAPKALAELSGGAYALMWAEKPSNKIFIAANTERPIHWAAVKGKNILLVASESEMLYWLARRNQMQIEQVYYPAAGQIWEFDPAGDLRSGVVHDVPKPEKKPFISSAKPAISRENASYKTEDNYGPSHTDSQGFPYNEEVSFIMKRSVKDTGNRPDARIIFGEVISNKTAEVSPAVILSGTTTTEENLANAYDAVVRVVGTRSILDKTTGVRDTILIVAPPFKIFSGPDPLREDEKQLDIAMEKATTKAHSEVNWDDLPFGESASLPTVRGPGGRFISVPQYMELVKHGCAGCCCDLFLADSDQIVWTGSTKTDPVCTSCAITMAYSL